MFSGGCFASTRADGFRVCGLRGDIAVLVFAAVMFLGSIVSPPSLMDDVDSANARVALAMLESGDWISARLNGVLYLDKAPLNYWLMALSYWIFGVSDWAARIPMALAAAVLAWLTARFGAWAFSPRAGFYAGLCLASSVGMFLFTRVRIPDAAVTLAITLALWAFMRAVEEDEPRPRRWAFLWAAAMAAGVLLKGLIAVVFPLGVGFLYLAVSGRLLIVETYRRLHLGWAALIFAAVAAPWHAAAIIGNPPLFDFTFESRAGEYRGFFWRYIINEHLLRYLNTRYPRDYNTMPLAWFWASQLVWLFPWSAFLPAAARLGYRPSSRAGRARLLALCWIGFVLVFFSLSTRQEYYTMPCYPAFALLIGSAIAEGGVWIRRGLTAAAAVAGAALAAITAVLYQVKSLPTPGDISAALTNNEELYTLSLGHMGDLTLESFAYLRLPLALAAAAMAIGAAARWRPAGERALLSLAVMMMLFTQAARLALATFDPHLSSRALAEAYRAGPPGELIINDEYYAFSSVVFYADRDVLILNGLRNNLEYGAHAPGAPDVFIGDQEFLRRWSGPGLCYAVTYRDRLGELERVVGAAALYPVVESGGKLLLSNRPPDGEPDGGGPSSGQ